MKLSLTFITVLGYGTYEACSILDFGFAILDCRLRIEAGQSKIHKSKIPSMRLRHRFVRVAVLFIVVLFVRHGLRQIDHRQHYEYERLNERHEHAKHDREDRNQRRDQSKRNACPICSSAYMFTNKRSDNVTGRTLLDMISTMKISHPIAISITPESPPVKCFR